MGQLKSLERRLQKDDTLTKRYRSTLNQTTIQVIYQPVVNSGASGLPKLKLTEISGDSLEWPE